VDVEIYCTRPGCPKPKNSFSDLDDLSILKNVPQKYCSCCEMPLILDGRYMPIKELGRGGFGAAFLTCDRRTPGMRSCVVKQLQPRTDLNGEQIRKVTELFHREAEVLEKLGTHPYIPALDAFFSLQISPPPPDKQWGQNHQQELFYLVQQYIDGEDLQQELRRKKSFSEDEVIEVLQGILEVLEFVHNNNSIHRDIKPSNIMRSRDGKLYLVDFGAVKQIVATGTKQPSPDTTNVLPSESITRVHTPGFAPPEQRDGIAVYPSSDLYALAASCVFLLSGKEPTNFIEPYTKTWNWKEQIQISDHLARILERMLKEKPIDRFGSAKEVLNALKQRTLSNFDWLVAPFLTGFEVGLLGLVLKNALPPTIGVGLAAIILLGLIYVQYQRIILRKHILIIVGTTLAIALLSLSFLPTSLQVPIFGLQLPNNHLLVAFAAMLVGIFGIVLIGLSQLIYQILVRI
jgi:serine/threonine protein kinase